MRKILLAAVCTAVIAASASAQAAAPAAGERFGIGMFTYQNRTFVGVVMRHPMELQSSGGVVVDLAAAAKAANVTVPTNDVMTIIDQWETAGVNAKVKQVVAQVGAALDKKTKLDYVLDFSAVKAERPFVPRLALYGFSNYPGTIAEDLKKAPEPPAPDMPGLWKRAAGDTRPVNPRIFLVPAIDTVFSGDGDPVINWRNDVRQKYEYECELIGVIGKPMWRVSPENAKDYFFGYTQGNDISDRQARAPDKWSDLGTAMKGWDTFKPIGPFVVPRDFVDPTNETLKMSIVDSDNKRHELQDDNTKTAYHSLYEYAAYLSNMLTVPVGTVLALGTPPGSHGGMGRSMRPGDKNICSYAGLGTLHNTVVAEDSPEAKAWIAKRNTRVGLTTASN